MIHQTRPWLGAVPWQTVIDTNQKLYESNKEEERREATSHPMTQRNYEQAQALWERARQKAMTLTEALEQCRQCPDTDSEPHHVRQRGGYRYGGMDEAHAGDIEQ